MNSSLTEAHSEQRIRKSSEIKLLPVDRIRVLNSRSRNKRFYAGIVDNISNIGLKRPITVTQSGADDKGPIFNLVCGEGRLDAFKALGEAMIPCVVVDASDQDAYLMSLVENLARRRHTHEEILIAIRLLKERGYSVAQISSKTGLEPKYIAVMLHLLKNGEQRLIAAVERGWLSITLAEKISRAGGAEVQAVMVEAYEKGLLRGAELMKVRRLIDTRTAVGKGYHDGSRKLDKKLTPNRLLQTYQNEVRRQKITIKKAEVIESRLIFIVSALKRFLVDENFRTLLRAEGIEDMPQQLVERMRREGRK
jgi:ParB family chromosome partitioning protein